MYPVTFLNLIFFITYFREQNNIFWQTYCTEHDSRRKKVIEYTRFLFWDFVFPQY